MHDPTSGRAERLYAGPALGSSLNIARISVDANGRDDSSIDVGLGLTSGLLVPVGSFMSCGEVRFTASGARQTGRS